MRTRVYVDGFNLYYGCTKGTSYKWLDIGKFCAVMLPKNQIQQIKYFTALVQPREDDLDQPVRQQIYFRALRTIPSLEIHLGRFQVKVVSMRIAQPHPGENKYVNVIRTDEKGSDVNLASHLLMDGVQNLYEVAVVVSGDTDLLTPIQMVRNDLKKAVGVINPQERVSRMLQKAATFYRSVREPVLAQSQFPPILRDANGEFHKPKAW